MSVWCNSCGRLSQDPEFCDHCNADLEAFGGNLPPERCPLGGDSVALSEDQRHALAFPEASALLHVEGRYWRVHWIGQAEWKTRGPLLEDRLALSSSSLPPGRLIDDPQGRWLVFEAVFDETPPWNATQFVDPVLELSRVLAYTQSLARALEALHQHQLVWLRFDPNALEDAGPLQQKQTSDPAGLRLLRITNLDVELFPFRLMPERVRVHPQFAAPEIVQFRIADIGPSTDVFHLAMFTYYWLAGSLPDGLPGDGLEQVDFEIPFLRIFAPRLPIGVLPVIERGLSLTPKARQETPRQFADALSESVERARKRRARLAPVHWEIGAHTRTGRAKTGTQRVNEDAVFIKEFERGALVAVADGVSTCDIGSGALASTMTTIVLENAFSDGCTHQTFSDIVASATSTGSQGLLDWALARGCRADLEAGKDLMGTTLTVGWLQQHELSLANLGDSRAYLITEHAIEQLTVDGDLASDLLAQGGSPQEVRELGGMARALRECVGGCTRDPDGKLCILPESTQPKVTRWPLMPGDVLILCSDGLVEEGYFLEPKTVFDIVRRSRDLSAEDLALRLVDAADAMQRVPTKLEPDGFGDNISCIVVKIKE